MKNLELSILIPVNKFDYFEEAISSVKKIRSKKEIIIATPKEFADIAKSYEKEDSSIKAISYSSSLEGNLGKIRNLLFEKAEGEYILFFDGDDIAKWETYSSSIKNLRANPEIAVLLMHHSILKWEDTWNIPSWNERHKAPSIKLVDYLLDRQFQTGCAIFKREFLIEVQAYCGKLCEAEHSPREYSLLLRCLEWYLETEKDWDIKVLEDECLTYRTNWSADQVTSQRAEIIEEGFDHYEKWICKIFPQLKKNTEKRKHKKDLRRAQFKKLTKLKKEDLIIIPRTMDEYVEGLLQTHSEEEVDLMLSTGKPITKWEERPWIDQTSFQA